MYKSKLQHVCQQQSWSLPEYTTERVGPDHNPRFKSTVTVNGVPFQPPDHFRSSKEAQNQAAKVAFDHFMTSSAPNKPLQYSPHQPPPHASSPSISSSSGYSTSIQHFDLRPSNLVALQPTIQEMTQTPVVNENPFGVRDNKKSTGYSTSIADFDIGPSTAVTLQPALEEMKRTPLVNETQFEVRGDKKTTVVQHLYKNRLQTYAQKRNVPLPMYSFEREGPPHASRFRCKVIVDGKSYECLNFFPTIREAENAAAKVAFESLSLYKVEEDESGLYKSLLQEFAQKKGFYLPKYSTTISGPPHTATFVSTVEIGGQIFQGEAAKNKKQAEMNAAKVAYADLQEPRANQSPTILSSGDTSARASQSPTILSSGDTSARASQRPILSSGDASARASQSPTILSSGDTSASESQGPTILSFGDTSARASQSPTILSSGDTLKEALKVSSSILQSVISTDDFPQIAKLEPSLIIHKEQDEEDRDGNQERYSSNMTTGHSEIRPLHPHSPSPDEGKNAKRNKCSASSDNVYAYLRDPFCAISTSPEDGLSSPSMPLESTANSLIDLSSDSHTGNGDFPCRKVSVYPRKLNVAIPDGASVLSYSDDKWMAVLMDSNQNH